MKRLSLIVNLSLVSTRGWSVRSVVRILGRGTSNERNRDVILALLKNLSTFLST